jgi:hypothetical protein
VAAKNNYATVDNHQDVELITKLSSGNISRQPRWASQPTAAHSPNACIKVSSPQVTRASIKASQRVKLLGQSTQPTKNNTTTPPAATHQEHHHNQDHITITKSPPHNQPCSCVEQQGRFTPQHTIKSNHPSKPKTNMVT